MRRGKMEPGSGHEYESVPLSELRQGRMGKHYELVENILRQLREVPEGHALKIPLKSAANISKANLRSAILRAAHSRGVHLSTYSDKDHFYAWTRTEKTAGYERKRRRSARGDR